jgi:hypothetical protein
LNRGTTPLVLCTALQPLFTTGGLGVRLTAGTLLFATNEFRRTAVLRFLVAGGSSEQEPETEEGTSK